MLMGSCFCELEVEGGGKVDGSGVDANSVLPFRNGGVEVGIKGDVTAQSENDGSGGRVSNSGGEGGRDAL